jgi:UDP-N-acetylglucosamine:LPS N-acetylglucosamine transferase
MPREVYRYAFNPDVPFDDVLATLDLALIAVESLHGESRSRLDARFTHDRAKRAVVIDASTNVGQALNQVFVGYAQREYGESSLVVTRAGAGAPEAACAT